MILIFGAKLTPAGAPTPTLRRRVMGALATGRRLAAPLYIVSGAPGRSGLAEATVMRELLLAAGVPAAAIEMDDRSRDTFDSAVAFWRMLRTQPHLGPAWVASSRYHIPRCRMLLAMLGVRTRPADMPGDLPSLGLFGWLFMLIREAAAIPYDAALMLLRRGQLRQGP